MKIRNILLALSGSCQSGYAADLSWRLAARLDAEITAMHVVDSHSAWEFLGHEEPRFLDSSRYLLAYQRLCKDLFCLGEELIFAYAQESKRQGIETTCYLDEGNPAKEICRRAKEHDLVVIGHSPAGFCRENPRSQFLRLSLSESLAHDCRSPLLVVQDQIESWESMTILVSIEHINEKYINGCLDLALALGLKPALVCLSVAGRNVETPAQFAENLRAANPRLANVPIAVSQALAEQQIETISDWNFPTAGQPWNISANTLVVVPTRELSGERVSVLASSASLSVRFLTLRSLLLWPEEFVGDNSPARFNSQSLACAGDTQ